MRGSADAAYQPFDLWGQRGWPQQEVVGESHYAEDIRSLFGDRLTAAGMELYLPAQLIPEPDNRYDPNAVSVRINGRRVGYLPREDAARYAGVLSALLERGLLPQVEARVWGGVRTEYEDDGRGRERERSIFVGSVELDLAEPHLLAPTNRPPDPPYAMLPYGNAIQVTGEENHMAHLAPLLNREGEAWVHVTLHETVEQLARSTRTLVEVRVDGAAVGRLSPRMSGELLPVIRYLAERGVTAAGRAILKGNRLKADVVLHVARANQVPQDWLDAPPVVGVPRQIAPSHDAASGPHVATAPATHQADVPDAAGTGMVWRFNPPPGWPAPPEGWVPPPDWRPPPDWPPAPPGWQFWVAVPAPAPDS